MLTFYSPVNNSSVVLGIYYIFALFAGVILVISRLQERILLVILRRVGECFVFSLLSGVILIQTIGLICGEAYMENSAGGGAVFGMLAMFVAAFAWPISFVALTLVDLGRRFGIHNWVLSTKKELLILTGTLAVWTGVAILFVRRTTNC